MSKNSTTTLYLVSLVIAGMSQISAYQGQTQSLMIPVTKSSQIGFRQAFNTYQWNYNLNFPIPLNKKLEIAITEDFQSSLLKVGKSEDKWKDNQKLGLNLLYQFLPCWTFQFTSSALIFSDHQSGFANDIKTNQSAVGIRFKPKETAELIPSAGVKWDERLNQKDFGPTYALNIKLDQLKWEDYDNNLNFLMTGDQFQVRQNRDILLNYQVAREFYTDTRDTLKIFLNQKRRDNYVSEKGDIECLKEDIKQFNNVLQYRIAADFQLYLNTFLLNRKVEVSHTSPEEKRTRIDYRWDNQLALNLARSKWQGQLQLDYWTQEQDYHIPITVKNLPFSKRTSFIAPDNAGSQLTLTSQLTVKAFRTDSITWYTSISRFRYDTPDTNNFDDRDEFRLHVNLSETHIFSTVLNLSLEGNVNLYHLVYIFGERSADNNWNRIFRLTSRIHYVPSTRVRLQQSFEVLANYVDYDYELDPLKVRSFIFRKFSLETLLEYQLSRRTLTNVNFRLELEENGKLYWERWSESPLISRKNYWVRAVINHQLTPTLVLAPGFHLYTRTEWKHTHGKTGAYQIERFREFRTLGPILQIVFQPHSRLKFYFSGMRQAVQSSLKKEYFINNIDLDLSWYF